MSNGAVILDVDGTLVDSNDAHASAWVEAFAERRITVPFWIVPRVTVSTVPPLIATIAGRGVCASGTCAKGSAGPIPSVNRIASRT